MRLALATRLGVALVVCALVGCGSSAGAQRQTELTVLAAASLTHVFPEIGELFTDDHPDVGFTFSFAGTDQLAAQIQEGAPADVFAGASTTYADELLQSGDIEPFEPFCTNQLTLVVPSSNPAGIADPQDLAVRPVMLVIGAETVPIGAYTRKVLSNLDALYGSGYSTSVLERVVSEEDSVSSILTKVSTGEADAGFVYVTDARTAGSKVRAFDLPAEAQAVATYPAAVVAASSHAGLARQFVAFLLEAPAQRILGRAGFGPAPG